MILQRVSMHQFVDRIPPHQRPWHLLSALTVIVIAVFHLIQPPEVALWWVPLGLFTVWVGAGVFLPARLDDGIMRLVGIGYFVIGAALYYAVVRSDLIGYVLLFALYPALFARLRLLTAIPLAVIIGVLSVLAEVIGTTEGPFLSLAGWVAGGFGTVGAIVLGLFIHRLSTISDERQQLIEQLEAARDELAAIEREAGVMEERQRLSREIHDTLAQGFTSIVMNLEAAEGALDGATLPPTAQKHIELARETARDSLREARRMVSALRPDLLEKASSIDEAIRRLARRWSVDTGIEVDVSTTGQMVPLPVEHEIALLRGAQEALNNIRKHANASEAAITLSYMGDTMTLDIHDDGAGFDLSQTKPGQEGGFGLHGMRERIEALSGSFDVESQPGEGTTIALSLPLVETPMARIEER
jgi:signal transduction histidine kinase